MDNSLKHPQDIAALAHPQVVPQLEHPQNEPAKDRPACRRCSEGADTHDEGCPLCPPSNNAAAAGATSRTFGVQTQAGIDVSRASAMAERSAMEALEQLGPLICAGDRYKARVFHQALVSAFMAGASWGAGLAIERLVKGFDLAGAEIEPK